METTAADTLKIHHQPQTLRGIAVDRIRKAIISGHFRSGDRLVERVLCDQLGVSRSVVREAIRYLEAEGLVEVAPRSGPMVATLDWKRASQIYNIRLLLEAQAAADCARRADARTKSDLRVAFKSLEAAFTAAEPQKLYDATTRFYEVIFHAAGNEIAWEIVKGLNSRISRLRALTLASTDRHVSGPVRMGRICEAILVNDPEAAAQAVRDHLTEAASIAQRLLHADESGGQVTQ